MTRAERFARLFAGYLHPTVPASIADLCRDLKCRAPALMRASDVLADLGVSVSLSDAGWTADSITWPLCQKVAQDYADQVDAFRLAQGRR